MTFHDRLLSATAAERQAFLSTPILVQALARGVERPLYLAYLAQAYHHVRHTCPLLALAHQHCGSADESYRRALNHYLREEEGHDEWILNDIAALGGSPDDLPTPNWANRTMVGYVHYAVERVSPYAMLGMVHVLEGISSDIALHAARRIAGSLGLPLGKGFTYLLSHGALDREHVAFFAELVERLPSGTAQEAVIDTARIVYRLWGAMFEELAVGQGTGHAA